MLADTSLASVALPGGLFSGDGRLLCDAELRPLTGSEEDWLARNRSAPAARAVTRMLSECVVRVGDRAGGVELARSLLAGDRAFLMIELRRLTHGRALLAVIDCPSCAAPMDIDFDIDAVEVERPARLAPACEIESEGRTIRFRLPNGADEESVASMQPDAAVGELLRLCTLDDGGRPATAEEVERIAAAMEAAAPRVEPELDLTCPSCEHVFTLPFDTTAFFLDEMRVRSDQLLREVHTLALYYHWSEPEILRLTRDRRRAYLSLLSDAFLSG
jgi:hypothetical protein